MKTQIKMKAGDLPMIGLSGLRELFVGWTAPDQKDCVSDVVEGYHLDDYFDEQGRYKGPDQYGVEPEFREMTEDEVSCYFTEEKS